VDEAAFGIREPDVKAASGVQRKVVVERPVGSSLRAFAWVVVLASCHVQTRVTRVPEPDDAVEEVEGDDELPPARSWPVRTSTGPERVIAEARRELAAAQTTAYDHHTVIDEANGVYRCDCSAFVDYVLANAAPEALAELRSSSSVRRRPQARTYVALLQGLPARPASGSWRPLPSPADLRPGDIIAWRAPNERPDFTGHVNTGHVMVVDSPAVPGDADEWVIEVIDSSVGHGGDDPRRAPNRTGIGKGRVVLITHGARIVGFRRSAARATSPRWFSTVVLGRIE
jgi:hypothetical protein